MDENDKPKVMLRIATEDEPPTITLPSEFVDPERMVDGARYVLRIYGGKHFELVAD